MNSGIYWLIYLEKSIVRRILATAKFIPIIASFFINGYSFRTFYLPIISIYGHYFFLFNHNRFWAYRYSCHWYYKKAVRKIASTFFILPDDCFNILFIDIARIIWLVYGCIIFVRVPFIIWGVINTAGAINHRYGLRCLVHSLPLLSKTKQKKLTAK